MTLGNALNIFKNRKQQHDILETDECESLNCVTPPISSIDKALMYFAEIPFL